MNSKSQDRARPAAKQKPVAQENVALFLADDISVKACNLGSVLDLMFAQAGAVVTPDPQERIAAQNKLIALLECGERFLGDIKELCRGAATSGAEEDQSEEAPHVDARDAKTAPSRPHRNDPFQLALEMDGRQDAIHKLLQSLIATLGEVDSSPSLDTAFVLIECIQTRANDIKELLPQVYGMAKSLGGAA